MTRADIDRINAERLKEWAILLGDLHATAGVLIGVSHDDRVGEVNVLVPEGADVGLTIAFLEDAARLIRRKDYHRR